MVRSRYRTERVPLLDDVLSLEGVEFELELKGLTRDHMHTVPDTVLAHDAIARTEFTSRREPWMPASVFERVVLSATEFDTFDVVHVYAADADPSLVAQIHARGLVAHTNDAASRDEMERALDAGVDRLSTDHVQLAREVVPIPS